MVTLNLLNAVLYGQNSLKKSSTEKSHGSLLEVSNITNNQEKTGGREGPEGSFGDFRTFLAECDL